jgi:hypothetical protein
LRAILLLCAALVPIAAVLFLALRLVGAARLWPAALLIVTAPLQVYRSSSSAGANVSIFRLALLVAVVTYLVDLVRGRQRFRRTLFTSFAIYGALVGWQVVSLLFVTSNHSLAYRFLGQYAGGLAAAFIVTCYVERRDLRVILGLWGGAAVLPLLAGAYRVFSVRGGGGGNLPGLSELPLNLTIEAARQGGSTLLNGTQRLNATFSDPNQFGFYIATVFLALAGIVCVTTLMEKPRAWNGAISYALLMVAAAAATLGTYSRGAWLLVLVGAAVFVLLLGRSFWTRRRIVAACLAGVVALGLASPLLASRLEASEAGNAKSTQVHEHTMSKAVKLVARHPVVGVGLGSFGRYADQPPLISSTTSTFLTVAAELGFPGLVLLLAAIGVACVAAVRSVLHSSSEDRPLAAGLIAAFVALAVANVIGEAWMDDFQWILFGLVLAVTTQPCLDLARLSPPRRRAIGDKAPAVASGPTRETV